MEGMHNKGEIGIVFTKPGYTGSDGAYGGQAMENIQTSNIKEAQRVALTSFINPLHGSREVVMIHLETEGTVS